MALNPGFTTGWLWATALTATIISAIAGPLLLRSRWRKWGLFAFVAVALVFLGLISGGPENYYWGYIVLPLAVALSPLVATRAAPARLATLERRTMGRTRTIPKVRAILATSASARATENASKILGDALGERADSHALLLVGPAASAQLEGLDPETVERANASALDSETEDGRDVADRALKAAALASGPSDVVLFVDISWASEPRIVNALLDAWTRGADVVHSSRFGRPRWSLDAREAWERVRQILLGLVLPVEGATDHVSAGRLYSGSLLAQAYERQTGPLLSDWSPSGLAGLTGVLKYSGYVLEVDAGNVYRRSTKCGWADSLSSYASGIVRSWASWLTGSHG
jgi:hypothetical protein